MKKISIILLSLLSIQLSAQRAPKASELQELCDSLSVWLKGRTSVENELGLRQVMKRGSELDLYFNNELIFYPFHEEDVPWFTELVRSNLTQYAPGFKLGHIYAGRHSLNDLVEPQLGNDGHPAEYMLKTADPRQDSPRFIERVGADRYPGGLSDRYISLWQSHGRYYNESIDEWIWQRSSLHRTIEDIYTQSYVLPFLIPMLENAGAYVMTPRERDTNAIEYITDNDKSFPGPREGLTRRSGVYRETGNWKTAGEGFADIKKTYTFEDNPFHAGTVRMIECSGTKADANARWIPNIEKRGKYAVYVSYKTLGNSSESARYTVHHMGGTTEFKVNQRRGGGTWIYLGTFEFDRGTDGYVAIDNRGDRNTVVTADAVKIGGGMGKLERGGRTSGVASYLEGAHYWMQWAGVDTEITRDKDTDYINDYASRGPWTAMMREKKQIPFDLALAFHSDAGLALNDSIVGTLAIYTLMEDGKRRFSDGRDRLTSRLLGEFVQDQVVSDLRDDFDPDWTRRGLWDKSYSECRTAGIPAMILELLSHQNLADMRHGLDPAFRFTVCRAVYKGILKTISAFYGCDYTVQPLPVHSFAVRFADSDNALLSWKPTLDDKEPTAVADSYIVYTRVDGGAFDAGRKVDTEFARIKISKGHIYSFKVEACNSGGRSFPSEILSVGMPENSSKDAVAIVNNFDRISAPSWFDGEGFGGFDSRIDSGVPYINDLSYSGDVYEFRHDAEYVDDNYPGFGASYMDCAGGIVAGNSFDFPYLHGKLFFEAGKPFFSLSGEAFCQEGCSARTLDLICGKQRRTQIGRGAVPDRFQVFPDSLISAVKDFTARGGNVFISGSDIAADAVEPDEKAFISDILGYKLTSSFASSSGRIADMEFYTHPNPESYCIESADGITAADGRSSVWMRYSGSGQGAAVIFDAGGYKVASMGVPLETIKKESDRRHVVESILKYFDRDVRK